MLNSREAVEEGCGKREDGDGGDSERWEGGEGEDGTTDAKKIRRELAKRKVEKHASKEKKEDPGPRCDCVNLHLTVYKCVGV